MGWGGDRGLGRHEVREGDGQGGDGAGQGWDRAWMGQGDRVGTRAGIGGNLQTMLTDTHL